MEPFTAAGGRRVPGTLEPSRLQQYEYKQVAKGKKSIGGIYSKSDILSEALLQITRLTQHIFVPNVVQIWASHRTFHLTSTFV